MNKEEINKALGELVVMKNKLAATSYDNKEYDKIEDSVHDLEDDFMENYGDLLTDVLGDVHEEYCPEDEVLNPIAYIANKYIEKENDEFSVSINDGVLVEVEKFGADEGRLVIIPNPLRIVLNLEKQKVVVWN